MWILLVNPTDSKTTQLVFEVGAAQTPGSACCQREGHLQAVGASQQQAGLGLSPPGEKSGYRRCQERSAAPRTPKLSRAFSNWDLRAVLHIPATTLALQPGTTPISKAETTRPLARGHRDSRFIGKE